MARICQITGKKQWWEIAFPTPIKRPNADLMQICSEKIYWVEEDCWISLNVSAAGLRLINKIGLDAALKQAAEKGYLNR